MNKRSPTGRTLNGPGWNEKTRRALERLAQSGTGRRLPVVFDFDNTLVWGDIGEATLAVLARSGLLKPKTLLRALCPPFRLAGKGEIRIESCSDVTEYYEALLEATKEEDGDPMPMANGYAWIVEIMERLRPLDVVNATREAFECSREPAAAYIEVRPGGRTYPAPFFYPEMVELLVLLLRHQFDLWIVSASNVWSVRWMVLHVLNPKLRHLGARTGLNPDHVIGISTLLRDARGRLCKDRVLVRSHSGYAAMDGKVLAEFRLTSRLEFPVPTYSGKIAAIFDALGRSPHLCAGDSPGDFPMLAFSRYQLWIARSDKAAYQKGVRAMMSKTRNGAWMLQAAFTTGRPRFVSGL